MPRTAQEIRDAIIAKDVIKREIVLVNGEEVEVRGLTTLQRSNIWEQATDAEDNVDTRILYPVLTIECAFVPGTEEKVFRLEDVDCIQGLSAEATNTIALTAIRLSGLSAKEVARIKKELPGTPKSGSTSSSPNASA